MYKAFLDMHSGSGTSTLEMLESGKQESSELIEAVALVSDTTSENDGYRKQLRIKAYKAFEWLKSEYTVYNLSICALVSGALEKIMWSFMKWQHTDAWLSMDTAPLLQMSNPKRSPAVRCMNELSSMMQTLEISTSSGMGLTIMEFLEGGI